MVAHALCLDVEPLPLKRILFPISLTRDLNNHDFFTDQKTFMLKMVGDQMRRGIFGRKKKHVTTGRRCTNYRKFNKFRMSPSSRPKKLSAFWEEAHCLQVTA